MAKLVTASCVYLMFCLGAVASHAATEEEAKSISRLYSAAFDRYPDKGGLNFWIRQFDNGQSLNAIAARFNSSPEFIETYGELSNQAYVETVFQNVLGRAPAQEGVVFFTSRLDDGRTTTSRVLANISESPENVAKTAVVFDTIFEETNGDWCFDIDGDGNADNIRNLYWSVTNWDQSSWQ